MTAYLASLGDQILEEASVGWTPTVPLPKSGISPTAAWPLTSFTAAVSIVVAYFAFLLIMVPYMKQDKVKPISKELIYPVSFVYNVVQIFLCAYMTVEALLIAYRQGYTPFPYPKCNPFDAVNAPVAKLLWLFYVSKVLDFMDTIQIVFKKSWKQLSFLHVYHHSTIFLFYWLNVNRGYDGDIYLTVLLNGVIHTVMYTYYFISLHTKDIWWKKYLTLMQMAQFVTMMSQAGVIMMNGDSTFPPRVTAAYCGSR